MDYLPNQYHHCATNRVTLHHHELLQREKFVFDFQFVQKRSWKHFFTELIVNKLLQIHFLLSVQ